MEKKSNKIVKYVGAGLLTATLATGIGLKIYDTHIDHTQEICPISKICAIHVPISGKYTPGFTYGIALHQWPEMAKDYAEKGIKDVNISYGKLTKNVLETNTYSATKKILEDGSEVYAAPSGCIITTDENGNKICIENKISEEDMGYGFDSTWGESSFDPLTNEFVFENQEYLRVR